MSCRMAVGRRGLYQLRLTIPRTGIVGVIRVRSSTKCRIPRTRTTAIPVVGTAIASGSVRIYVYDLTNWLLDLFDELLSLPTA